MKLNIFWLSTGFKNPFQILQAGLGKKPKATSTVIPLLKPQTQWTDPNQRINHVFNPLRVYFYWIQVNLGSDPIEQSKAMWQRKLRNLVANFENNASGAT